VAVAIAVALASGRPTAVPAAQENGKVLARKSREVGGRTYTFEKVLDADGRVRETIRRDGVVVRGVPAAPRALASEALRKRLAAAADTDPIAVNLALRPVDQAGESELESGGMYHEQGRLISHQHNGQAVEPSDVEEINRARDERQRERRALRLKNQQQRLAAFAERNGLAGVRRVETALRRGEDTLSVTLAAGEIRRLLAAKDADLVGVELAFPVEDQIAGAMVDTNISAYALPYLTTRGAGIGIYMTESGCADEAGRPNYDRLAGAQTDHSQNVFGIMRAVSPDSYIYCRGGAVLPQAADIDGVGGNPAIRVINRSNGGNDTTSYSTLDRDWDNLGYNNSLAIFNAAGNNGGGTGNIISPAKGLNVMAVGNYDDSIDTINGSSSFVNTELGSAKPEMSAPGTSINAGGFIMTGTSMASPHAAAFAADMMSGWSVYVGRPQVVYASMIGGATDAIAGGFDKVGPGGIDYLSAYYDGWTYYYTGGNAAFETFDSGDGADDGYISRVVYIGSTSDKVRVAIAWLNRGTYTYDHRADAHPIGQDLDLYVYGPTGAYVGGSASWDNQYEVVNFTPTTTGYYTIKVNRFANRDAASDFRLGLKINLYD
jgi:hypothetical protein